MKTTDKKMLIEAMEFAIENDVCFEYKPHVNGFGFFNHRLKICSDAIYFDHSDKRKKFNKAKREMLKK